MADALPSDLYSDAPSAFLATKSGRAPFAELLLATVNRSGAVAESTVFGLVGAWGSGKSSILEWLKEQLTIGSDPHDWTVVEFNPWAFSDLPSTQAGFFAALLSGYDGRASSSRVIRRQISRFARAVAPIGSIASVVGIDGRGILQGIGDAAAGDQSIAAQQRRLVALLHKRAAPVLVILDDLDRLSGEELLLCLRLVRLLGRLPHVHYVLSYDEATLLDVLARTDLAGASATRAQEYLEKVVQVRLDVPTPGPTDIDLLIALGLSRLAVMGFTLSAAEQPRFALFTIEVLIDRLDTPRAIRRYFSQAMMFAGQVSGEVDKVDALILTWLRTTEPSVYRWIQHRRAALTVETNPGATETSDLIDQIRRATTNSDRIDGVLVAMKSIFPVLAGGDSAPRAPRIAHPHYFDRYFRFGLAEDDVADEVFRRALVAGPTGRRVSDEIARDRARVVEFMRDQPERAAAKLMVATRDAGMLTWEDVTWLDSLADGDLLRFEGSSVGGVLSSCAALAFQRAPWLVDRAINEWRWLSDFVYVALRLAVDPGIDGADALRLSEEQRYALAEQMDARFASSSDAAVLPPLVSRLPSDRWARAVEEWMFHDAERFIEWARTNDGDSSLMDRLIHFAMTKPSGRSEFARKLDGFDLKNLLTAFPYEQISETYAAEIESAEVLAPETVLDDNSENRVRLLLSTLKAGNLPELIDW